MTEGNEYPSSLTRWLARRPKRDVAILSLVLTVVIGYVDYVTGTNISLSVVYVLPIAMAAWFVSQSYAVTISILSVVIWSYGDDLFSNHTIPIAVEAWNGLIRLLFYLLAVVLMVRLRALQNNLNELVYERTAALTKEIRERQRLELNMMEVGNRERRRIGQDLHDGLCQHLTGTALLGHTLAERLSASQRAEAKDATKIVDHIEEAITLTRNVAKGIYPVEMQPEGLMEALADFAATTSDMFKIPCRFVCDSPALLNSPTAATHLYRIAQEAVSNAVRHSSATEIIMSLEVLDGGLRLCVSDNGSGIAIPVRSGDGIGLQVMADRAKTIGANLSIVRNAAGGTEVSCTLPYDETGEG